MYAQDVLSHSFAQVEQADFSARAKPGRWILRDLRHPAIGYAEKAVLGALSSRDERGDGSIHPSLDTIAGDTNLSRSTVKRVVSFLRAIGVLLVTSGGRTWHRDGSHTDRCNTYNIVWSRLTELPSTTRVTWQTTGHVGESADCYRFTVDLGGGHREPVRSFVNTNTPEEGGWEGARARTYESDRVLYDESQTSFGGYVDGAVAARASNAITVAQECQPMASPTQVTEHEPFEHQHVTTPPRSPATNDFEQVVLEAIATSDNAAVRKVGTAYTARKLLGNALAKGISKIAAATMIVAGITAFGDALACESDHMDQPTHRVAKRLVAFCNANRKVRSPHTPRGSTMGHEPTRGSVVNQNDMVRLSRQPSMQQAQHSSTFVTDEEFRVALRKHKSLERLADVDNWVSAMVMRFAESATQLKHIVQALDGYDRDNGWQASDKKIEVLAREVGRYLHNARRLFKAEEPAPAPAKTTIPQWFVDAGLTQDLNTLVAKYAMSADVAQDLFELFVSSSRARAFVHADWCAAFVEFCQREAPRMLRQKQFNKLANEPRHSGKQAAKRYDRRADVSDEELRHARDALDACWQCARGTPHIKDEADDAVLSHLWHQARLAAASSPEWSNATPIEIKRVLGKWLMRWLKTKDETIVQAGYPLAWMLANDCARLKAWGLPASKSPEQQHKPVSTQGAPERITPAAPMPDEFKRLFSVGSPGDMKPVSRRV